MEFNPQKQLAGLLEWMDQQMTQCGGKTAVIGISGGKDSSTVAALAVAVIVYAAPMAGRTCTAC